MKFVSASISDEACKVNGTAISKKWSLDTLAFSSQLPHQEISINSRGMTISQVQEKKVINNTNCMHVSYFKLRYKYTIHCSHSPAIHHSHQTPPKCVETFLQDLGVTHWNLRYTNPQRELFLSWVPEAKKKHTAK